MSASFVQALQAAREVAGGQHYPKGALYLVATPIGNLADLTLRALHVLQLADTLACEDTRHTQSLLRACGIDKAGHQLLALHQHNELEAAQTLIARLTDGQRVAYASDAGTPGISDPGARLVAAVVAAGFRVVPLPGASSVTAALSVAGAVALGDADGLGASGFVFVGFLPSKAMALATAVQTLSQEPRAVVLMEAPHRIAALASALALLGPRRVTVGRELTKQFEEIATLPCADFSTWLAASPLRSKGEFALVLHPQTAVAVDDSLRVLQLLMAELPLKTAVKLASDITGVARNGLYETALREKAAESGT